MKFPFKLPPASNNSAEKEEEIQFPKLFELDEILDVEEIPKDKVRVEKQDPLDPRFFKDVSHLPEDIANTVKTAYPRIMQTIEVMWGTQELQNRFARWLLTDQDGRKGWPNDVYKALFIIADFHSIAFGLEGNPIWDNTRDKW